MNAYAYSALNSTSAIAIGTATSQRAPGVVIPFPTPETREEIVSNSIAVGEAVAEAVRETILDDEADDQADQPEELPGGNALIERQHLAAAIEIAESVIESKNTVPVLSNVRMKAGNNVATIIGTDLDIEIAVTVPAAIDAGFDVTLPAKKLKELLKGAPKAEYVDFQDKEGVVSLDFEKVRYNLQSIPASYFPALNAPKDAAFFTMPGNAFAEGLDAVSGAISTEATRYYLNGIFFENRDLGGDQRELRMVATDGHRLYMQKLEMPCVVGTWPVDRYMSGVIIPQKTVKLLAKLMRGKKRPESVGVSVSAASCRFVFSYEFGEVTITSKNIDGTFPDYMRVVPTYSNFPAARFDNAALAEGIKAVSLISSERGKAFKLTVDGSGGNLVVNNPEEGSAHATVPCQWESEPVEIGFNARYMLDALDVAGDGELSIYIQDASSPGVVVGKRDGWLAVVMPMRV